MSETFETSELDLDKLDFAIKKQIQSISLYHLIDEKTDGVGAFRFKAAGMLNAELTRENPPDTAEIISDENHPRRLGKEDGLLIFVKDLEEANKAAVIDLSDHVLEADKKIRDATLIAILRLKTAMLPSTFRMIEDNIENAKSEDESTRLIAALRIYDALNQDYLLNIVGLRKCCEFQFDEYDKFYKRVFRPTVQTLNSFTPPAVRPNEQKQDVETWIENWRELNIDDTLLALNDLCGYLPPTIYMAASSLLEESIIQEASERVWEIATSPGDYKIKYHAVLLLCANPHVIQPEHIKDFEVLVTGLLDETRRSGPHFSRNDVNEEEPSRWDALYDLARHFLAHLESSVPVVDSAISVSYAWWMAEQVVKSFFFFYDRPLSSMEEILKEELELSVGKWSFSRTRSNPSSARKDIIFTASIWSDSLLVQLIENFSRLTEITSPEFIDRLFKAVNDAMILNRFNLAEDNAKTYLIDHVPVEKIRRLAESRVGQEAGALLGLVEASEVINQVNGINTLLTDFTNENFNVGFYVGFALQARQFAGRDAGSAPIEFLQNSSWTSDAFLKSSDLNLGLLVTFLSEWQLSQSDEWRIRFSHVLASMSLEADNIDRKEFLFELCLRSAINVDISSPIERLLSSAQKETYLEYANTWNGRLGFFAFHSTPWVSYRLRGFLAKIQRFLPME